MEAKKFYEQPQAEVIEIELQGAIMIKSGTVIPDDNAPAMNDDLTL